MDSDSQERLSHSLFADTSAFNQVYEIPPVEPPVVDNKIFHTRRIADLVEYAIEAIENANGDEALSPLEEIRDLLKRERP